MTAPSASLVWILLVYAWIANYLIRMALSSLLPPIMAELSLSYTRAGLLATAFLYAYTAMQLPAGLLGDRLGRKRVVTFAMESGLPTGLAWLQIPSGERWPDLLPPQQGRDATDCHAGGQNPKRRQVGRPAFEIDVLACPRCGGRMSLIVTIEDPRAIRQIIAHSGLPTEVPQPRPPPPRTADLFSDTHA